MTPSSVQTPERLLRRLEWRVIRRLDGRLQGDYRTMFRGAGVDVADLREYEPGDDVRHIDWNVTARTDVAHVRTFPRRPRAHRRGCCWIARRRWVSGRPSGRRRQCSSRRRLLWRACLPVAATESARSCTTTLSSDTPAAQWPHPRAAARPRAASAGSRSRRQHRSEAS